METLQSTIFIEFDVNTKKITFLRGDGIVDYDSNVTSIYVRVKYKNLSGNTVYLTPSELEDYEFSLYTIKPATNNANVIAGEVTDELKQNVYGGVVKFEIPRKCTNRLGIVKCEIHINQEKKIIASSTFVLDIKQSLVTAFDDELLDDEDFPVLKQLILEIQKDSNIDDNNRSKITTYSSDKIETIKENLNWQIKEKASKKDLNVERKRIDLLSKIESGETDGNAELLDVRIGADGITYDSAGQSVRGQLVKKLDINEVDFGNSVKPILEDGYYYTDDGHMHEDASFKRTIKIELNKVPLVANAKPFSIVFWENDNYVAGLNYDDTNNLVGDIPAEFTHVGINFMVNDNPDGFDELYLYIDNSFYKNKIIHDQLLNSIDTINHIIHDQLLNSIDTINNCVSTQSLILNEINEIQDKLTIKERITFTVENGFITTDGTFISHESWMTTEHIYIEDGVNYSISTNLNNNTIGIPYFYDENGIFLGYSKISDGNTVDYKIEYIEEFPNAKSFRISYQNTDSLVIYKKYIKGYKDEVNVKYCVPVYGQSNSKGYSAYPVISIDPIYPTMLLDENSRTLTERTTPDSNVKRPIVESSCSGTGEQFLLEYLTNNDCNIEFYSFKDGFGGASIKQLAKGSSNYDSVLNKIRNIVNSTDSKIVVPAFCYVQGESECDNLILDWKNDLIQLQSDFENDIKAITGQTESVLCCIYNLSWLPNNDQKTLYNYPHMNVCTAQMELVRDNEKFIMSSPSYALIYNDWDRIHLANKGQKLLGVYQGHSIYESVVKGNKFKGLCPQNISVDNNRITIEYNVPVPPLEFDTSIISKVDDYYGFSVIDSNNTNIITNVSLDTDNNSVIIECSQSPSNCKLRYGCNGTTETGRDTGSRGNLRDSQGYFVQKYILGEYHQIHNWALMFEKTL